MAVFTFDDSHVRSVQEDENFFVDYAEWALDQGGKLAELFQSGNRLAAHCKANREADPVYWEPIFKQIRDAGYIPCVSSRVVTDDRIAGFKAMGVELIYYSDCLNIDKVL